MSFISNQEPPLWPQVFIIYLAAVNVLAFIAYGADKQKARRNQWRISENTLLMLTAIGGSAGAFAGMFIFRHKVKKWKFRIGIPCVLVLQIIVGCLLLLNIS